MQPRVKRKNTAKTTFTRFLGFATLAGMKRILGLCLLPLLLSGCASTVTNLTPLQQPRNQDNQYAVEVAFSSRQQTLRWDSIKPFIIVGGEAIPMRPTPLLTNRWEGLVPAAAEKKNVTYRYKIDYKFNRMGDAPGNESVISKPYTLKITE